MRSRLAVTLLLATAGCSHVLQDMKARAAFDFKDCPEEKISVAPLGGYAYGARGCGKSLKCNDVPYAGLLCSNVEVDPPPKAAAPAEASTQTPASPP